MAKQSESRQQEENACLVDTGLEANLELWQRVVRIIATHTLTEINFKKAAGALKFLSRGRGYNK